MAWTQAARDAAAMTRKIHQKIKSNRETGRTDARLAISNGYAFQNANIATPKVRKALATQLKAIRKSIKKGQSPDTSPAYFAGGSTYARNRAKRMAKYA